MRQYGVFQAFWMSFYSPELYRDAARNWKGIGLGYLFLLTALLWIPQAVGMQFSVHQFATVTLPPIVAQMPAAVVFENGKMTTDEARPYRIENPASKELLAVIDMTQEKPPAELGKEYVFIAHTAAALKKSEAETRLYSLERMTEKRVITQEKIMRWARIGAALFVPAATLFLVPVSAAWHMLSALILGLLPFFNGSPLEERFASRLRVAAVALTPSIVFGEMLSILDLLFPFSWLMQWGIAVWYVWFAASSIKAPDETAPAAS